jgi:signal transduction protein with GAF and PtsI domain
MSTKLAPRPANEDQRVKAVIKTGLIDAPDNTAFQIYCELAKDITGFEYASFSLFDADMQCSIAKVGDDDEKPGDKGLRHENNICSYVLLDTEPLLMKDMSKDPIWKNHPEFLKGNAEWYGYAGFPVTNKDNFALGTLCMMNRTPKALNENQISLVKKITSNIALLIDSQVAQKEITSQKILEALISFQKYHGSLNINDFKMFISLISDVSVEEKDATNLIQNGLCKLDSKSSVTMTSKGLELQSSMKLDVKPMKKIKIAGEAAQSLIDDMLSTIN